MDRGRIASFAALALAASALSACNVVVTQDPVVRPGEASPAQMRDGIWTSPGDKCAGSTRPGRRRLARVREPRPWCATASC